ncbi:MAG: phosphoribosylanthranilate isomerase, partial [Flavobacteriales bacterium]
LGTKTIQLHGEESPEVCSAYRKEGYIVFKAFGIDEGFHFEAISKYVGNVDYFLFDYKGDKAGGNGIQFDWKILDFYTYDVPFFLSGGINNKHASEINELNHSQLFGIDVNSGFEITPGIKNVLLITSFSKELS